MYDRLMMTSEDRAVGHIQFYVPFGEVTPLEELVFVF